MKLQNFDIVAIRSARELLSNQIPMAQDEAEWSWRDWQASLADDRNDSMKAMSERRWNDAGKALAELHGVLKQLERLQYELSRELDRRATAGTPEEGKI